MKHGLLNDIELDVQELKCLVEAVSKEYNQTLCEVAKRHISQMHSRLNVLYEELVTLSEGSSVEQDPHEALPVSITEEVIEDLGNDANLRNAEEIVVADVVVHIDENSDAPVEEYFTETGSNRPEDIRNENGESGRPSSVPLSEVSHATVFVSDILRTNLRNSISLNDSFRFTRELFEGDSEKMNRVVKTVDGMNSLDEALLYLGKEIELNEENDAALDFIELLRKRFN